MNWCTDKQASFVRSLLLKKGTKNELEGNIITLAGKKYRFNFKNKTGLAGGLLLDEAKNVIKFLLENK